MDYQKLRPHRALVDRSPNEFAYEVAADRNLMGPEMAEYST